MKIFLITLSVCSCFLSSLAQGRVKSDVSMIKRQVEEIKNDLERAKVCFPDLKPDKIIFCTGVEMSLDVVKKIADGDLNTCVKMIEEKGYRFAQEGNHQSVRKDLWDSFYQSTKWAETLHEEKYVVLKKIASKVDCLHELVHVYQWTSTNNHPLSPLVRKKKYKALEKNLLDASDDVAFISKTNLKKGQNLASNIQQSIKVLNDYGKISGWLDERDVYAFLNGICNKELACSEDDWDTIVGNLFQMKDLLPWRMQNEITAKALKSVRKKEEKYIDEQGFNALTEEDYREIDQLFKKSWEELIAYVSKKNLKLYQFVLSDKSSKDSLERIPHETLTKLQEPEKPILTHLLNYSKISSGVILGKFLCTENPKDAFIILTSSSSKEVLIHEYMHYLQSMKNPSYCHALTAQNATAEDFKKGRIPRKDYEALILSDKVMIWKTEREVYKFMTEHLSQGALENTNNKIQSLIYQSRLMKGKEMDLERKSEDLAGTKMAFSVNENLPVVDILGKYFVLDLGAMDSIMAPAFAFEKIPFNKIAPLKIKMTTNSLAESLEAPEVIVDMPLSISDKTFNSSEWVLANLKLPFAEGVLGLDFFKEQEMVIYPKEKMIEFTTFKDKPGNALMLQRDFDGQIKAIEFVCPKDELVVRLDSGSQVLGDLSERIPAKVKRELQSKKGYRCGKLSLSGPFEKVIQNTTMFSHGVGLNLGWPWIARFKKVSISLKKGWILLE